MGKGTYNYLLVFADKEIISGYHVPLIFFCRIIDITVPLGNAAPLPG